MLPQGSPGHGLDHLLTSSAAEIVFSWDPEEDGWIRVGMSPLRMTAGPSSLLKMLFVTPDRIKFLPRSVTRKGFEGEGQCLVSQGLSSLPGLI